MILIAADSLNLASGRRILVLGSMRSDGTSATRDETWRGCTGEARKGIVQIDRFLRLLTSDWNTGEALPNPALLSKTTHVPPFATKAILGS